MEVEGIRVLLLEDDALIAMDAEEMLLAIGVARVHTVHDLASARTALDAGVIDAAVLDLRIGSEDSLGFARELAARRIPFIFTSGYSSVAERPTDGLRNVPHVEKPYTGTLLRAALTAITGQRPNR